MKLITAVLGITLLGASCVGAEVTGDSPATVTTADYPKDLVVLPKLVVEAQSAPALLTINFRHHLMWSGVKSLRFDQVPAAWAKAGIHLNDEIVAINGRRLDGMHFKDFRALRENVFKPVDEKTATQVELTFDFQRHGENHLSRIRVVLKSSAALITRT
ncbi:MAG TPA: hypothetical protein VMB21_06180 [Candidatus Limnocylindria bacterium]|jgi:hypothetical protein|nr:hypothetical protein [Candidatus Limnocylindria bacterium]HTL67142.1 hypothetical protein [Lacunisphaera sp.]